MVAEALAAYEKQQQEAEANPTPTPAATETPAEPTPQPTPDNGHIPGSVWQGVWDEKAAQAVKLIQQNRLEPATTVQINYETCTDTTARYTGTAGNLVCGMYLGTAARPQRCGLPLQRQGLSGQCALQCLGWI